MEQRLIQVWDSNTNLQQIVQLYDNIHRLLATNSHIEFPLEVVWSKAGKGLFIVSLEMNGPLISILC